MTKIGVTFETWQKLSVLASELLYKGITDGGVQHEPDQFRKQGYKAQLEHAADHCDMEQDIATYGYEGPEPHEDHLAHALTRILFAALLKEEQENG